MTGGVFIDITGKKFGMLTVIKLDEMIRGDAKWICRCDCGNTKSFYGYNLKNSGTVSCGCYAKQKSRERFTSNLTNKVYGCLLVIEQKGTDKAKNTRWLVRCVYCKKEKVVLGLNLKNGNTRSCSCQERKSNVTKYKDISGNKYGLLTVVDYVGSDKDGNALWNVICDCGNKKVVAGYELRRKLYSCGCLSESLIASELKSYYVKKHNAEKEYKVLKNSKTNHWLPYDIYIPCGENSKINGIYIEVHGEQHYRFVTGWHKTRDSFEYNKQLDRKKRKFARKNGIYVEVDLRKIKTTEQAIEYIETIINKAR